MGKVAPAATDEGVVSKNLALNARKRYPISQNGAQVALPLLHPTISIRCRREAAAVPIPLDGMGLGASGIAARLRLRRNSPHLDCNPKIPLSRVLGFLGTSPKEVPKWVWAKPKVFLPSQGLIHPFLSGAKNRASPILASGTAARLWLYQISHPLRL